MKDITSLKLKCIHTIEKKITIPDSGYFAKSDTSIRLACYNEGRLQYITLPTRIDAAKFFKKHRIIDDYDVNGDNVIMYVKDIVTIAVPNDCPKMFETMKTIRWEDLEINRSQLHTIAARNDYESRGLSKIIELIAA